MAGVRESTFIGSGLQAAVSGLARSVDLRNRAQFLRMIAADYIGKERACLLGIAVRYEIMADNSKENTAHRHAAR